jgi:hypothetical protein
MPLSRLDRVVHYPTKLAFAFRSCSLAHEAHATLLRSDRS